VVKDRRRGFDSLIILVTWQIWLQQNARVFNSGSSPVSSVVQAIWSECALWGRAKLIVGSQLVGK
jgi:hypothetical protein